MTESVVKTRPTYTEELSRGGIRLAEMRALARVWQPAEPTGAFVERVRADDVLGKATARTVRDYVAAFTHRFCLPSDRAARHLRRLAPPGVARQVFEDVLFHYIATRDHLLRDFTVLRYWPSVRDGHLSIGVDDARRFIWEAEEDGRIARPWSSAVRKDMPARVLNALSDFGLLGPLRAGRRAVLPYQPADEIIAYLAYLLHDDGVTDASLAEHLVWSLFGLERSDVWNRLDSLGGGGWFILQRAGPVVRISWTRHDVEEVVDVLAGR